MKLIQLLTTLTFFIFASNSQAALNAYAALTAGGTALSGDVTMQEIGGIDVSTDHIEIYQVEHNIKPGKNKLISGPIVILKRIDQTSPLLLQAMSEGQRIDGDIKIFDNDPDSGETRHRFTIRLTQAEVVGISSNLPDAFNAEDSNRPPYERIELQPFSLMWVDEINSEEYFVTF